MIIELKGIEYTKQKIKEISDGAIENLNIFDKSEYKDALIAAINFNMDRTK